MPRVTARKKWRADVELEIERLALSVQYIEKGKGSSKKRFLVPTDWLEKDGKTVVFDVGKRLKGWLKDVVATMKSTWKDRIQYGVVCKSLPQAGYVPIASLDDIAPSRNWDSFQHKVDYDLNKLPKPNVEVIITERGTSIFALHYVLNKPVTVKASIYCFAYGIEPESVKTWLKEMGPIKGLGDMHSSSAGYGCFKVKSFKVVEEKEIPF